MVPMRALQTKRVVNRLFMYVMIVGLCFSLGSCIKSSEVQATISKRTDEAQKNIDAAASRKTSNTDTANPLIVTNKVWSGNAARRMHRGIPLPARFEEERGITLVSAEPMSLIDITTAISAQTGIPIRLASLSLPGRSAATSSTNSSSSASGTGPSSDMPISYEGPLSGLLDRLSAHFGISWRFDGSAVSISRYETRIFVVEALPGTLSVNEGMKDDTSSSSGSSSSGSSSGGSASTSSLTQNSETKMEFKYWEELTAALQAIIGGHGNVVVSPSMGTVTVTTTPESMSIISDYISKENKRLSRQIAISVQIYSLSLGKSEDFNLAFSGFLSHLSGQISGINYVGPASPITPLNSAIAATTLSTLNVAILNSPSDPGLGTTEVFKALSAVGDTSQVAQFSMTTLNNRPVSRRIGTDTAYVAAITESTTTSTASATTLTPTIGTIHEGFSLQLTPRLLEDGRILLQYSLSLIDLTSMGSQDFGNNSVSLPITDNRIFIQQSVLRGGQTLIIAGVDQETLAQNRRGVGSPDNFFLGGGVSSTDNRIMMFMSLTPQILDVGADEEKG